MRRIPLILSFLALLPASALAQSTWHVDHSGNGDFLTIQNAIDNSNVITGDTIIVHPGIYFENIKNPSKGLSLVSKSGPSNTTIDGSDLLESVIRLEGNTEQNRIEGFSITGGNCPESSSSAHYGGGIYASDSSMLILENNRIFGNRAKYGAGVHVHESETLIKNNLFYDNRADTGHPTSDGGALHIGWNCTVTVEGSTFTNNFAERSGGAVLVDVGNTVSFTNCIFWSNDAAEEDCLRLFASGNNVNFSYCCLDPTGAIGDGNSSSTPPPGYTWINNPANGNYYALTFSDGDRVPADQEAQSIGAHLVDILDENENTWIYDNFVQSNGEPVWIGLQKINDTWGWSSGAPVNYTNWDPSGEGDSGEEWAGMRDSNARWFDVDTDTNWQYQGLMEYSPPTSGDQWSIDSSCIQGNPEFVSSFDEDFHLSHIDAGQVVDSPCVDRGSPNLIRFGTTRTDSLADEGVIDMGYHWGGEVVDGWFVNEANGHWYRLTQTLGSWDACEAEALSYEGNLVTIRDAAEADWVEQTFFSVTCSGGGDFGAWIGLYQDLDDPTAWEPAGGWKWSSGETFDPAVFQDWANAEPNNADNAEHWAHLIRKVGYTDIGWNDYAQTAPHMQCDLPGIIEVPFSPYDTDRDGLDDDDELAIGTDVYDQDTDDDGLSDGEEGDGSGPSGIADDFEDGILSSDWVANGSRGSLLEQYGRAESHSRGNLTSAQEHGNPDESPLTIHGVLTDVASPGATFMTIAWRAEFGTSGSSGQAEADAFFWYHELSNSNGEVYLGDFAMASPGNPYLDAAQFSIGLGESVEFTIVDDAGWVTIDITNLDSGQAASLSGQLNTDNGFGNYFKFYGIESAGSISGLEEIAISHGIGNFESALTFDSDNDGLGDGQEVGVDSIYWDGHGLPGIGGTDPAIFVADSDPATTTDSMDADTDDDGISDGDEDLNLDGAIGTWETDPNVFDTDSDGLGDGLEIGMTNATVTADTDLSVFIEDSDSATTTDPLNADTDGGGLSDGNEDANKDGTFMVIVESDPNNYQDDYFDFAVTNLVAGQHAVLTSTSCKPGGIVYPVYSLSGQGPTSVGLLGFDLMLTAPFEVLSPGLVSPSGTAISTIAIPPNAPSGYNVYWQAVEVFYGVIYRASNPLVTQIQ